MREARLHPNSLQEIPALTGKEGMGKIRVLVVEDSPVVLEFLRFVIDQDPRLTVVAAVSSADKLLEILPRVRPHVVCMDICLPGMDGFEATRRIMCQHPTPIVLVSASVNVHDQEATLRALEAGALTVLEKPVGTTHQDYQVLAERLCTQLAIMSQVKVIRQTAFRRNRKADPPPARLHFSPTAGRFQMVGIACSTGGPGALVRLLGTLGGRLPVPVLLVQHISASFHEGFVAWLRQVSPLPVETARDRELPAPGVLYVAPPDYHLVVDGTRLRLSKAPPVCAQRPSGTVLFQSMARALGSMALGILLTGMGEDGAAGLAEIRRAGGYTLAESEKTAVVYGMPAAAVRLGAVQESLPLEAIGPRVLALLNGENRSDGEGDADTRH